MIHRKTTKSRFISTGLLLLAGTAFSALTACVPDDPDTCQVFEHAGHVGAQAALTLPIIASSSVHAWGNNSMRWRSSDLGAVGLHDRISSIRIRAQWHAVSLYLYEHDNFNGGGRVYHCEKGQTCWADGVGWVNDRTSSLICQYEYGDDVDEPGSEDVRVPMAGVADRWNTFVSAMIEDIESRARNYATRITWMTRSQVCQILQWVSCDRYQDVLKLRHNFELDMPFPLRNRDVRISLFLQPHLENQGFGHWYHGWEVWTEGGIGSGTILDQVVDAVEQLDPLPLALLFSAAEAEPPGRTLTGKYRLQMSIPPASSGITDWAGDWNVPTMVVNRLRN